MENLQVGAVVQLKSGGPKMTIQRLIGDDASNIGIKAADEYFKLRGFKDGDVICNWFEGSALRDGTFKKENLTHLEG